MKISVLIPTWRRTQKLTNALNSLLENEIHPDEVIVICRDIDLESQKCVQDFMSLNKFEIVMGIVSEPGVIKAENLAISMSKGDILCFLDDDAITPKSWIKNIRKHFQEDSSLAAVGGPDYILHHSNPNYRRVVNSVGKITWYAKVIGNHHHMVNKILEVDVLKGVNMSFRKPFVRLLDENLQSEHHAGNGSHWELDLCMYVKAKGGRMIFDPVLDLIHDSNHSHFVHKDNFINNARNLTYVMLKNLNWFSCVIFIMYILLIGNEQIYGISKFIKQIFSIGLKQSMTNYYYSFIGIKNGIFCYARSLR